MNKFPLIKLPYNLTKLPSGKLIVNIIIFLALGTILIIFLIQLLFIIFLNEKIKHRFTEEVSSKTAGEYRIDINKLTVNLFTQSIRLNDISLNRETDSIRIVAEADNLNLLDFDPFDLLITRRVNIGKTEFVNPSVNIYRLPVKTSADRDYKEFSSGNILKGSLKSLSVEEIDISNADIRIYNNFEGTIPLITSKNNHFRISKFRIDKTVSDSGKHFSADTMYLELNEIYYKTPDKLYTFYINRIVASNKKSGLTIDTFRLIPNFSKSEFAAKAGRQTDRFVVTTGGLKFNKFNIRNFLEKNRIIANSLIIKELNISAYRDKNDKRIPSRSKSVQELLQSIPFYIKVDSIKIQDGKIIYQEIAPGSEKPGEIFFDDLSALISGFTNDKNNYPEHLKVSASSMLMNKGRLNVQYRFPLKTEKMVFYCSGKLYSLPMDALNPMLEPYLKATMKGGITDSMIFSFHADDISSKGEIKLVYHDLKMEFVNEKNKTGFFHDLFSFLTHSLILKEDNPSRNKPMRIYEINYKRDTTRFIFNYSWKSILSGIKPVLGIPDKRSNKREVSYVR